MPNQKQVMFSNKDLFQLGVVFVALSFLVLVGTQVNTIVVANDSTQSTSLEQSEDVSSQDRAQVHTEPKILRIPKLNLETTFTEPVGLLENGEVEVPESFDQVSWYKYSPAPGNLGPAVVLGHVDSYEGPAVFFSIGQLKVGDEIVVVYEDDSELVFEVSESKLFEQAEFPTELVYGDIDHAGLRLVTCSGWYDRTINRYTHNRVVFAKLIEKN